MKSGVEKGLHIGMYEYAIVIQLFQLIGLVNHETGIMCSPRMKVMRRMKDLPK